VHAAGFEQVWAHQKIAVAAHEVHGQALRRGLEHSDALQGEGVWVVVAHPHLKQITQDEEGVCGGVRHVLCPRIKRGTLMGV
jgi:hypothetical protein